MGDQAHLRDPAHLVPGAALRSAQADPGLLTTKLSPPRLPPGFVSRPRVDALFDKGVRGPLTLVSAGAGWGKTLSTAAWASSPPRVGPVAWVSLDAGDNQPRSFWSYVVGALRATPDVAADNPLVGLVPGLGSDDETLRRLVAGLEGLPRPVVLVLDDFHVIDDPAVLAALDTLLRTPTPQLRLVLLCRADPVLPLHRLRVAEQLVEIRSSDLALPVADAAALLAHDGVELTGGDAELLVERTEGWPAGLRLAALFLAREEPGHEVADFGGDDHAVMEYLAEEVLERHPPELRRFLLQTSVVERVDASLAERLTGEVRSQQHLEELAASNTFVVALGTGHTWYRYHGLLRQVLRHRLSVEAPEVVPDLHRRAASWFAEHGRPLEALGQACDAGDWDLLGHLLVTHALPLALSVEREALAKVLARVPVQHLADSPELGLVAATRVYLAARYAELRPHLVRVEQQLAERDPATSTAARIGLLVVRIPMSRALGDIDRLLESAAGVLELLAGPGMTLPAAGGYRVTALANLGTGLLWSGRFDEAERRLEEGLAEVDGAPDGARINMLAHLALAAAVSGRLADAEERATAAIQLTQDRGWSPAVQEATAHLALAIVHLQRDDVDEALRAIAAGRAAAAPEPASTFAMGLFQARVDAAAGRVDAARAQLARLQHARGSWQLPRLLARWSRVTEAEVELAGGRPGEALERLRPPLPEDAGEPLVSERLLRARALLELSDPRGADAALAPLRDLGLEHRSSVELALLTALVADRLREDRRASEALSQALEAAEPQGLRLPFVAWNASHLPQLLSRVKVVHPRLQRFVEELEADRDGGGSWRPPADELALALTERERSVLEYLPSMMTYPEIAAQLFVSVNTVKSHLRHLYAKLQVVNRRQAVTRARELGLLAP